METLRPVVGMDFEEFRRNVMEFTKVTMVTEVEIPNNKAKAMYTRTINSGVQVV